ncbi:HD domain-containing protein [Bradyrhizobium diazoefficiens]|nr:HD domain-containing protein [Bradyrhizobium diazoefficiens]MBR0847853.1 HD domain-containing protein [Bradyrhizobium diazoefficiens]
MSATLPALTVETVDDVLDTQWRGDRSMLAPYRNHVLRVASFCRALTEAVDPFELGVAGAFHDLGVWNVPTWDYLAPSRRMAREWLAARGRTDCADRIEAMIEHHHKLTRYRGLHETAVEAFRRADWMDVSRGRLRFGVPAGTIETIKRAHPNLGFHAFLRKRTARAFIETPLRPLPMFHW